MDFRAALVRAANTAWVLSTSIPELADHADTRVRIGDRQPLTFGRGFVAAATPYAAQFAAHDIPIEGLGKQVEALEAALAETTGRRDELKQTRGTLKASLTRALAAVDTLDVTVANTFASDPVTLEAWKLERRVDKPRQRARAVKLAASSAPDTSPASPVAVAPATAAETVSEAPVVTDADATKAA